MTNAVQWRDLHPKVKRGFIAMKSNLTIVDDVAYDINGNDVTDKITIGPNYSQEQMRGLEAVDVLSTHEKENGGFVFALFRQSRMVEERFPTLTPQDMARLMYIGTYTSWKDGQLIYDNGRSIDKDGLHGLTKMSRNRFNEFYNRLTDENIICANDDGDLFMNPGIFYRGSLKDYDYDVEDVQYTRMFRKTVRDLYAVYNGRSLGQLAIIYEVMPFINFKTNVVSYNPEEDNEDVVKPMPLDKLAILLGYSNAQKLKTALNKVKVDDKPVFGFFENPYDRRSKRIVVNPRVIFAAGASELLALKVLFNM